MNSPLSFSRWTKQLRADLDLTQEMLAQQVGCSIETIRAFETGRRRPSRAMTERLANVLHVPSNERAEFLRMARLVVEPPEQSNSSEQRSVQSSITTNARRSIQLPIPPTVMIGRAIERADVKRCIADPTCRLLTIVGAGGIGKTRLALQVAMDVAEQFADGAAFVPLGHVLSSDHVAAAIADAIGCPLSAMHTPEESLLAFLRDRQMLLVLDNLEHLLDATSLLIALLEKAGNVHVLGTSRERLQLQSEWVFELEGLATPQRDTRMEIDRCEAVLLFLERARQVSKDFTLSSANRTAVSHICRLLDGMPLGIELAANWVRTLTPNEIASELDRTLDLPEAGLRDLPQRHRSLRAVFEHSWHLLTEAEQAVLCRLSVFRAGFTRAAALHVAEATLPVLVALTDKSLLRRAQTGRYEMHPLVRWFAAAQLQERPTWADEALERHATFFAHWLHQREAALKAAMSDGEVVAELRVEIDNVWLAWDWMISRRRSDLFELGAACFSFFLEMRCLFREGITLFGRAAAALAEGKRSAVSTSTSADTSAYGQMLGYQGWLTYRNGNYGRGRELLEQCLAVLQTEDDSSALFIPVFGLGCVLLSSGEYEQSRQLLMQSLKLAQTTHNQWRTAYALTMLGQLAISQGELHTAHDVLQQALAIWRIIGGGTSPCLNRLGLVLLELQDYDQAQILLQESVMISSNRGDVEDTAAAMVILAKVASMQAKFGEAIYLFEESLAMFREVGAPSRLAKALVDLGWTYHAQSNANAAHNSFLDALRAAHEYQFMPIMIDALFGIASLVAEHQLSATGFGMLIHVVQHPSTEQGTRLRAQRLQAQIEQQLSPAQLAAVQTAVTPQSFEAVVADVLNAAPTHQAF